MHTARHTASSGEDFIGAAAQVSAGSRAMSLAPEVASAIDRAVDSSAAELAALSSRIHDNPELRFEEHKACAWITELLVARGHAVEGDVAGISTAFRARAGTAGPRVAILAEYDALPGVGHACGHNLIAAGAVGAFLAAAEVVKSLGGAGEVVLLGTPAEEGGGGKIEMIEAGVFDERRRGDDVPPLRPRPARPHDAGLALAHVRLQGQALARGASRPTRARARSPRASTPSASSTGSACTFATGCACTGT